MAPTNDPNDPNAYVNRDFGPNFNDYKVTYGTDLEFISDTLYDTRSYVSGTTVNLPFFSSAQTEDLTNLALGNMIPDKQGFLVMSIRVFPKLLPRSTAQAATGTNQTGVANDMAQLLNNGRVKFNFLNKDYGVFPIWLLPSGGGTWPVISTEGAVAAGLVVDFAGNGIPDARNMYVLEQPLFLPPMSKLGITMLWPTALTLVSGNTNIVLLFDGIMVRPVQ